MSTYECLSIMITFSLLIIAILEFKNQNKK